MENPKLQKLLSLLGKDNKKPTLEKVNRSIELLRIKEVAQWQQVEQEFKALQKTIKFYKNILEPTLLVRFYSLIFSQENINKAIEKLNKELESKQK